MLELKTYTFAEMSQLLNGTSDIQGIKRKLQRYGVEFDMNGRGRSATFEIKNISQPFKVFCITELGIDANADFTKIRNLFYYLFCSDKFAELPVTEMERIMEQDGMKIVRQTISKWIEHLHKIGYIHLDQADFNYYAIYSDDNGEKAYKTITKEQYNEGWKTYWDNRDEVDSGFAYASMYDLIGGHPCKKPKIEHNAFYSEEIKRLIDAVNEAFLE